MTAYIIRRLLYLIPVVMGVLLVTFCLFTLVGGDISQQIAGKNADAETIAEIRHEYGFDKPLFLAIILVSNRLKQSSQYHMGGRCQLS